MQDAALNFFKTLLETPGPSGYEQPVQKVVREYVEAFADDVSVDSHGNLIACINPGQSRRVMLAGHCDQIGMLVSYIDENGFIYAQTIGGWDPQQLIGQRMTIWSSQGPLSAVISRKPIHLLSDSERKTVVQIEEMWLDIGAASQSEAQELVQVGDPVTFQLGFQAMRNNLANAPAMDDRTGVWVVMEALRKAKELKPNCSIYAVSTVQEEIGLRGAKTSAHGIDPHVGIAVDVTHATDCPTIDKNQKGDISLGKGPVVFRGPNMNPRVVDGLRNTAKENDLPYQLGAIGRAAPNDSNALQMTRAGVAAGLVAIPNRYMHSAVETISLDDLETAAALLGHYCGSLTLDSTLIP